MTDTSVEFFFVMEAIKICNLMGEENDVLPFRTIMCDMLPRFRSLPSAEQ